MRKIKNLPLIYYLGFFVLFFIIMTLAPHSVDDSYYDYLNMTNLFDIFKFSAGYGNGRIFGNMMAIILCKSVVAAGIVRSATVTGIIFFISKLFKKEKDLPVIALTGFLILSVGPLIFSNVYAWISAFSNYTPIILITLICLYLIKKQNEDRKNDAYSLLILFCLGTFGQLFVENATLNSIILACIIFAISIISKGGRRLPSFIYLLSTGFGAAIMVFCRLFVKDPRDIYSTVDYNARIDSVGALFNRLLNNSTVHIRSLPQCLAIFIIISALAIMLIKQNPQENKFLKAIRLPIMGIFIGYPFYAIFSLVLYFRKHPFFKNGIFVGLSLGMLMLYLLALILTCFFMNAKLRNMSLGLLAFSVFTMGYVLVLYPINPRILFYSYIILVILAVLWFIEVKSRLSEGSSKRALTALIALTLCLFAFLNVEYAKIHRNNNLVNSYIAHEVENGAKTVKICLLTNTDYFHHSFPSARLGNYFYHEKPKDVEFKVIAKEKWLKECLEPFLQAQDNK